MNRLESIKELIESLRDVSVDAGADDNKVYIGPRLVATWHDAESLERLEQLLTKYAPHLLQRLEIAQKALEKLHKHSEDENVANLHYSQLFVRRVCLDTLDQLKE